MLLAPALAQDEVDPIEVKRMMTMMIMMTILMMKMMMMTMMMTMIMTMLNMPPMQALSAAIPGSPGEDYPIYASPPDTSFACDGKVTGALISLLQHCSLLLAPCSYLLLTP